MAARIRKRHQDDVRAKIQASELINRLQAAAMGTIVLTDVQVKCIKILLDKSISNAPTVIAGDPDNPLGVGIEDSRAALAQRLARKLNAGSSAIGCNESEPGAG